MGLRDRIFRKSDTAQQLIPYVPPAMPRDGHFNTVKWISEPDYISDELRSFYPAAFEKDAPLSILKPHEIRAIVLGVEVAEYVDYLLRPYAEISLYGADFYVAKEKIVDLARVRLSKAEFGKLVDLALKSVAVVERHDNVNAKREWW